MIPNIQWWYMTDWTKTSPSLTKPSLSQLMLCDKIKISKNYDPIKVHPRLIATLFVHYWLGQCVIMLVMSSGDHGPSGDNKHSCDRSLLPANNRWWLGPVPQDISQFLVIKSKSITETFCSFELGLFGFLEYQITWIKTWSIFRFLANKLSFS